MDRAVGSGKAERLRAALNQPPDLVVVAPSNDAVFGANDGLVSNLSLVLGVVGGGASTTTALLTGLARLLCRALSMRAGEYVSVRSQRELLAASSPDVSDAHTVLPHLDVDANELALVYWAPPPSSTGPAATPADEARLQADAVLRSDDPVGSVQARQDDSDEREVLAPDWGPRCPASRSSPPEQPFPYCRSCSDWAGRR